MNNRIRERDRKIRSGATAWAMLGLGMCLLVLGGMNLFTNVLQIRHGHWQQNVVLSAALAVAFSVIPAIFGGWLVYRATAAFSPTTTGSDKSK